MRKPQVLEGFVRESKVRVLAAVLAVMLPASIVLADATSAMLNTAPP